MKEKILSNIDIKSLVTIVALVLWAGGSVWGVLNGKFDDVFDFFKSQFAIIIGVYFGTQIEKNKQKVEVTEQTELPPVTQDYE